MTYKIVLLAGVLILSASVLTLHPPLEIRPSIEFALQDLGTLPGDDASYAWGINAAGDVVGGSDGPNGMRAFLFTDEGGLAPLQCPDARPHCIAREVNVHGQVAGSAWASPVDWPGHAIRWTGGTPEDLGVLGIGSQSEAWGINETGAVAGYSYTGTTVGTHGFVFTDANGIVDATPAEGQAYMYDINDAGQRTGYRVDAGTYRLVRWGEGVSESFGTLPGLAHSYGTAINARGQVAGYAKSVKGDVERFVRYTDGVGLQNLGGVYDHNRAWGINSRGDVVGEGRPGSGLVRAILYRDGPGFQEINNLIDPSLGWYLFAATDINDKGQIVAYGSNLYVPGTHALRLTPNRVEDAPRALRIEGIWPDTIRLAWNPVATAGSYRVYESTDAFAPFPWHVLGETFGTAYDAVGQLTDGKDHFYIVRAVRGLDEGGNSTMAVKTQSSFPYGTGATHIAWFSVPYSSAYRRASDIAAALGPTQVDLVGKWDASRQTSIVYYHTGGGYKGEDFLIAPGDGLFLGLRKGFDWVWAGTDTDARLEFVSNSGHARDMNWFGLPFTSGYRVASDIARELGPQRISEIGRWDAATQSFERLAWTGSDWAGSDFLIRPGDGLYVTAISSFSWQPALLTPIVA